MTDLLWSVTFVNSVEACFKPFIELASSKMRWVVAEVKCLAGSL